MWMSTNSTRLTGCTLKPSPTQCLGVAGRICLTDLSDDAMLLLVVDIDLQILRIVEKVSRIVIVVDDMIVEFINIMGIR